MCYSLFLGTNQQQPPESPFIEGETMLYLSEESETEFEKPFEKVGLLEKFSKKYVYQVGSWQGCSCGFFFSPQTGEELSDETAKSVASNHKLLELLQNLTQNEAFVELFCCWEGDWQRPILAKKQQYLSEIRQIGVDFVWEEQVFVDFLK